VQEKRGNPRFSFQSVKKAAKRQNAELLKGEQKKPSPGGEGGKNL